MLFLYMTGLLAFGLTLDRIPGERDASILERLSIIAMGGVFWALVVGVTAYYIQPFFCIRYTVRFVCPVVAGCCLCILYCARASHSYESQINQLLLTAVCGASINLAYNPLFLD